MTYLTHIGMAIFLGLAVSAKLYNEQNSSKDDIIIANNVLLVILSIVLLTTKFLAFLAMLPIVAIVTIMVCNIAVNEPVFTPIEIRFFDRGYSLDWVIWVIIASAWYVIILFLV